jgi:hypothetical protein
MTVMTDRQGFPDLRDEAEAAGVSQARIGSQMGYRPDMFSRVMNGHQPPKGGLTAERFRREFRAALREIRSAGQ